MARRRTGGRDGGGNLVIEWVKPATLKPDPDNAMKHGDENRAAVRASLDRFGWVQPSVVWKGMMLGGNLRLEIAIERGDETIPIVRVDHLEERQARALAIALNQTGRLAEWDMGRLSEQLRLLADSADLFPGIDFNLDCLGFDPDEIAKILGPVQNEGQCDPDDVPAPPDEAVTQPGDLWILGNHRLLCGDSSSPTDLDRLLDGQPIHLVNMDPPYNVKVEPRSNNAIAAGLSSFQATHHQKLDVERHPGKSKPTGKKLRAKDRPLANDFVTDEEFDRLLDAWFGNAARVLVPGRGFYIWGGYANCANYPPFLKKHGLYFSQSIIWDKEHPVLTRKDFMGAHEWCFYGWKEGAGHEFFGPNNATDLWHIKKVNPQSMVHLTEKPVELAVRSMQFSSRAGENVLDLFGGSGSTLIGAEQTERRAFLMELDPLYCDVIVQRFEKFSGRKARRVCDEVAA